MKFKKTIALVLLILTLSLAGLCEDITVPAISLSAKAVPESEALMFTKQLGVGWNLGNTFDATGGSWIKNEMDIETAWQRDKTTEALIQAIKDAGFNTIRIPVSWHDHVDAEFNISDAWLNRVSQVVDWAYERDMYVIINIHHDNESAYFYPSNEYLESSKAYVSAIWRQLAEHFKDYDEHLIFENLNEPRLKDTSYEWISDDKIPAVAQAMDCINELNQVFVDTARLSGGMNAQRYLMVSGYAASVQSASSERFRLPNDTADNKIIVSVHAYSPYDFALQASSENGSRSEWSILNPSDKSELSIMLEGLYQKYIVNGIPVVMGEFGSRAKGDNVQARVDHAAFYVAAATARNIPCLWWDNNAFKGNGELFGLIHRSTLNWEYPEIVEAMVRYGMDNLSTIK